MAFDDAQVREQEGYGFGSHARSPVGVDGQLSFLDLLFAAGFFDQSLGQAVLRGIMGRSLLYQKSAENLWGRPYFHAFHPNESREGSEGGTGFESVRYAKIELTELKVSGKKEPKE
jgi:hypothetical protein